MRLIRIPKSPGRWRTVAVPETRDEWRPYRAFLPVLHEAERQAARALGVAAVAHGFVPGRSPVTCAAAHVGPWAVTLSFDLADWFDRVSTAQVARGLVLAGWSDAAALALAQRVTPDGVARQGLPTSPVAANLAAVPFDGRLSEALTRIGRTFGAALVYTRYADDLTISAGTETEALVQSIVAAVHEAAAAMGWTIAPRKTRCYRAAAGRRIVVGVSVGLSDLRLPRATRRRLRAARHQDPAAQRPATRGLIEWSALRLPRALRPARRIVLDGGPARPAGLAALQCDRRAVSPEAGVEGPGRACPAPSYSHVRYYTWNED
jgi:hypothetical protein